MMNNKYRKQIVRGVVSLISVGILLLIANYFVPRIEQKLFPRKPGISTRDNRTDLPDNTDIYLAGEWYRRKQNLDTVLVIGVDNREGLIESDAYNNEGQADFLMLLVKDNKSGDGFVVHINRDTITSIPVLSVSGKQLGRTNAQLALAYNYGNGRESSCENVMNAVQYLLYNIDIDHYVALSMEGVSILNDGVGGVEVEITDDFSSYDPELVIGEKVLLEGEHALNYVRARGGMADSSNLKRMERQRQYVVAWMEKAKTMSEKQISKLALSVSEEVLSDCRQGELLDLANDLVETNVERIYTLPGEAYLGEEFMEFHINESGTQALILDLFFENVTEEYE